MLWEILRSLGKILMTVQEIRAELVLMNSLLNSVNDKLARIDEDLTADAERG